MRPKNFRERALVVLMLFLSLGSYAQHGPQAENFKKMSTADYVQKHKDIAIREMMRSGIPASITLAQGIHESSNGNSGLARKANNHFGIKCHEWKGEGYYQWDDDPTESCFRVYANADSSYIDHSDFLMTRKRYGFLFEYESVDYVSWAHGLKKAGYATDSTYPQKLISTIERFKLYQYDVVMTPMLAGAADKIEQKTTEQPEVFVVPEHMQRNLRKKQKSVLFAEYKKGFFRQNATAYAFAKPNETALEFASRFDIPYRKFLLFNDMVDGDRLIDNQFCYIQPKKSKYKGSEVYHQVKETETMYEISQFYGIKLQDLLDRNLLRESEEPKKGEMVLLNEKAFKAPLLREVDKNVEIIKPEPQIVVEQVSPEKKVTEVKVENKSLIADLPTYPDAVYKSGEAINTNTKPDEAQLVPEFPTNFEYEPIKLEHERKKELPVVENKKTEIGSIEIKSDAKVVETSGLNAARAEIKFMLHTVQANETLFSIGKKYGIGWEQIKQYNNLASNELSAKQTLKIPR